ncbi:hypothetical protein [Bartonella sp. CE47NXGY]
MDLYIVRVFGHFGLLGAWNVVARIGGCICEWSGERWDEECC